MTDMLDTLIVGAGPAGLTAAVYLARFRRKVLFADTGESRADRIPTSRNLPGFAQGLHGRTLLERLPEQAQAYGVEVRPVRVAGLRGLDTGGFEAGLDGAAAW